MKNNSIFNSSEFGKHCELCHKNKPSQKYYKQINGKQLKICMNCWNKLELEKRNKKE